MKISGKVAKPHGEQPPLVFARSPITDSIVFKISPVPNYAEFELLCPPPKPGKMRTPQGVVDDLEAPSYVTAKVEHDLRRAQYLLLKSLEPSYIEWDSVRLESSETWGGIEAELQAVLTEQEFGALVDRVYRANVLTEDMLDKAADDLFQTQLEPAG